MEKTLKVSTDEERDKCIYEKGFIPGWIGEGGLQPEPTNEFLGASWRWNDARELLLEASKSIDPKVAERRNIRMANPAKGKRTSLNTIHASYQMVAPGEFARAHRHTVNAGRFIVESSSAFTTLDGEKITMEPNDIILTPNWVWHGLGCDDTSEGDGAFWIDFLDDPLVATLKTIFFEIRDEDYQEMIINDDSPLHIKWKTIQNDLENASLDEKERYGRRIRLNTPSISTMDLYVEHLEKKHITKPIKSTVGHIFICVEGAGHTNVAGKNFDWERGDVIAVPSWKPFYHQTRDESVLLEVTDEPVIKTLGWFREF